MTGSPVPVWVVSLARADGRRASMATAMRELGLPFEFVDAVDGEQLTKHELAQYSDVRATMVLGRGLTRGEIGCALSHRALYQRMVRDGVPEVLVLEDDAAPSAALRSILENTALLPPDRDIVTFYSTFGSADPVPLGDHPIVGESYVCRYRRHPYGTVAYLVRLQAAQRLVRVGLPVRRPADDLLFRDRPARLVVYGIEPNVVDHRLEFASDVHASPAPPVRSAFERVLGGAARASHRVARSVHRTE